MTNRKDGLTEVSKTYTAIVDGRPVVIHNVPMLQDPDTDGTFTWAAIRSARSG
jgi:hypothetical protein